METRVRELRESQGVSRKELAARIGVTYTTLAKWESNTNEMGLFDAKRIASALGVTLSDLIGPDAPRRDTRFDEIAGIYRSLPESGRASMLMMARGLRQGYSGEDAQARVAEAGV